MNFLNRLDLEELTGIHAGVFVLFLIIMVVVLIIVLFFLSRQLRTLTWKYNEFMRGKNGKSLENVLVERIRQVDRFIDDETENRQEIRAIMECFEHTYQKLGVVKYNAIDEIGGKLSFSVALLNRRDDGFILSALHSREGCFTYIKEVVNGKSITLLSEEEDEALQMAISDTYKVEI